MSVTVAVSVSLQSAPLGQGITPGNFQFTVMDAASRQVAQQVEADPNQVKFSLSPGKYTVFVQRLDSNGNPLGQTVSQQILVQATTCDVPRGLTVSGAQAV